MGEAIDGRRKTVTHRPMSPRLIIFDFNGVIVDDEHLHYRAFAQVLQEDGLTLTEREYFEHYLGLDDRGFFRQALSDKWRRPPAAAEVRALVERKADVYLELLGDDPATLPLFPGVVELVRRSAEHLPLAINSGARRREIELILERAGLRDCFPVVVSADEVEEGKPSPEGYLTALRRVRREVEGCRDVQPAQCLVIEDAPHGIAAAHAAGMRCVAVASSRPKSELAAADAVVERLEELDLSHTGVGAPRDRGGE